MEDVKFEVHILGYNGISEDTVFEFIDLSTGESYFKNLPDYAKKLPIAELNAKTRFVSDTRITSEGEFEFIVPWYKEEHLLVFLKSSSQKRKDFEKNVLPSILGS